MDSKSSSPQHSLTPSLACGPPSHSPHLLLLRVLLHGHPVLGPFPVSIHRRQLVEVGDDDQLRQGSPRA